MQEARCIENVRVFCIHKSKKGEHRMVHDYYNDKQTIQK